MSTHAWARRVATRALRVATLLFALAGCSTPGTKEELTPRTGYACCNLHYQRDKFSDANWNELPFFPPGTRMQITGFQYDRATLIVNGNEMYLRQEYGRAQETLGKFVSKVIVTEDPAPRMAAWPPDVQAAVKASKVMAGMTREQVLMSLGYPPTHATASLDDPVWNYWIGSFDRYEVRWGPDGRVREITGKTPLLNRVIYEPKR
jgi:outer membrane protein assembly factor BamE (lipoprotein component of BamABCDE complex)